MIKQTKRMTAALALGLALSAAASPATAGAVTYATIGEREIAPVAIRDMLDKSLLFNAAGFDGWFRDATRGKWVIKKDFELVQNRFFGATFAEFEYTYVKDGVTHTRVYHAVSGFDFPHYMRRPLTPPTSPGGRALTPEELASVDALRKADALERAATPVSSTDGLAAPGWSETQPYDNYFASSSVQKRTRVLDSDVSKIVPRNDLSTDGLPHDWDAEFKAVRTIERDIMAGEVTAKGLLKVAVSKPVCGSCGNAIRQFADIYDVDVHVTSYAEGTGAAKAFKVSRGNVLRSIWGHAVNRQTTGGLPGEPESMVDELGADALKACGPP